MGLVIANWIGQSSTSLFFPSSTLSIIYQSSNHKAPPSFSVFMIMDIILNIYPYRMFLWKMLSLSKDVTFGIKQSTLQVLLMFHK